MLLLFYTYVALNVIVAVNLLRSDLLNDLFNIALRLWVSSNALGRILVITSIFIVLDFILPGTLVAALLLAFYNTLQRFFTFIIS